jgi:hypothetical protein
MVVVVVHRAAMAVVGAAVAEASKIKAERIIELMGENALLLNAIQRAQRFVAEGKLDEADEVLTGVISKVLKMD